MSFILPKIDKPHQIILLSMPLRTQSYSRSLVLRISKVFLLAPLVKVASTEKKKTFHSPNS